MRQIRCCLHFQRRFRSTWRSSGGGRKRRGVFLFFHFFYPDSSKSWAGASFINPLCMRKALRFRDSKRLYLPCCILKKRRDRSNPRPRRSFIFLRTPSVPSIFSWRSAHIPCSSVRSACFQSGRFLPHHAATIHPLCFFEVFILVHDKIQMLENDPVTASGRNSFPSSFPYGVTCLRVVNDAADRFQLPLFSLFGKGHHCFRNGPGMPSGGGIFSPASAVYFFIMKS